MPISTSNFRSNSLSGTVSVINGFANISLDTVPYALEGNKSFVIKIRTGSVTGEVLAVSPTITLQDTSSVVSLTANVSSVAEGNAILYTLTTSNVVDGANVFFSTNSVVTANVNSNDFIGGNTGTITINNNVGTATLIANADLSLFDETGERFTLQIRTNNTAGNIVVTSSNVLISDTSNQYNVLSFVENSSTVAEGGTLTLTASIINIPAGTTLYYTTSGNATSATFTGGNTGSIVMNSISNTITLLPTGVPYGTTQNFAVQLRKDSLTGTVLATSNTIIAVDSALAYMTATGGTIIDSGGYRTHAFTTSGTLTVLALGTGPGNFADYLAVAGGAAGGRSAGSIYAGGGGGGAGGALLSNITFNSTGNSVITVGAGGAIRAFNEWPLLPGGNTTVIFTGTPTIIALGGGGGSHSWPDHGAGFGGARAGGSGGGGNTNTGFPAGAGTPGQGNPGGASSPTSFGGVGGSFAGGGGGAGEAGHYQPTDSVSPVSLTTQAGGNGIAVPWAPPSTGTSGPAPGRWFAGGGGGGGSPGGSAYTLSGGAGGGGAGGFSAGGYPTSAQALGTAHGGFDGGANATINTGGGGGGAGQGGASSGTGLAGTGGSGIVIIRYPYAAPITVSNVLTTANSFLVGSNITFTVNAQNANLITLYYSTDGNVTASNFINGNTGSFVANASGEIVTLQANTNIPVDESRSFRLQIRQDSTSGFISGSSANVTIDGFASQISATGGTITTSGGYRTHTFTNSANLIVTKVPQVQGNVEILMVAGGGGPGGSFSGPSTAGGGGGSGGVLYRANATLTAQSYTIVIGGGGGMTGGGGPTTGFSVVAAGGGAGGNNGNYPPPASGYSGGSGGGAGQPGGGGGATTQNSYSGWSSYGSAGQPTNGEGQAGGGGGSASVTSSISGGSVTYGGGGASTRFSPAPAVAPGSGNGGWGSRGDSPGYPSQISNGSPGIVIIRYPYS